MEGATTNQWFQVLGTVAKLAKDGYDVYQQRETAKDIESANDEEKEAAFELARRAAQKKLDKRKEQIAALDEWYKSRGQTPPEIDRTEYIIPEDWQPSKADLAELNIDYTQKPVPKVDYGAAILGAGSDVFSGYTGYEANKSGVEKEKDKIRNQIDTSNDHQEALDQLTKEGVDVSKLSASLGDTKTKSIADLPSDSPIKKQVTEDVISPFASAKTDTNSPFNVPTKKADPIVQSIVDSRKTEEAKPELYGSSKLITGKNKYQTSKNKYSPSKEPDTDELIMQLLKNRSKQ